MSPREMQKQGKRPDRSGLRHVLEGVIERLREGMDELAQQLERGLRPERPQAVPIPVPTRRSRRR